MCLWRKQVRWPCSSSDGSEATHCPAGATSWHLMDSAPWPWATAVQGCCGSSPPPQPLSPTPPSQPTRSSASPPGQPLHGCLGRGGSATRSPETAGYHVADFQEGEVAKEILVGHPVVVVRRAISGTPTRHHRTSENLPRPRLGCDGRQEDDGRAWD